MNIGFDAKRAFHNNTGLGNYSRTLISTLSKKFSENQYLLFNPKPNKKYIFQEKNIIEINPKNYFEKKIPTLWRSFLMLNEINNSCEIFHGLSNELPFRFNKSKCKFVVTIHDLIFIHYPKQYNFFDVWMYKLKFKFACQKADKIIAISEATKNDILNTYKNIPSNKIDVCYQSCDERFYKLELANKENIVKYNLPENYFIYVGSIIERKNLLSICKALKLFPKEENKFLVVVGKGEKYKLEIISYLEKNELRNQVIFLEDNFDSQNIFDDLPYLYHHAIALIYPSFKEGFGIPVLEAMASGTAVITSNISSLVEVGGNAAIYINPNSHEEIFNAMKLISENKNIRNEFIHKGKLNAANFSNEIAANAVMEVYKKMLD